MKRIARWSTIFLLLCSIIWAGTASAAMIVENNMGALNTLNSSFPSLPADHLHV